MINTLNEFKNQYGDIKISELIEILSKPKEQIYHYWISKSLIRKFYIISDKPGHWALILCKSIKEAESIIKELIIEDERNGIKSVYKKKEGDN